MFISSGYLETYYGTDGEIARFFVNREPPAHNLYWQGKLLYLRPSPGYLFIPLIIDLLYKSGIEKKQLLSEKFVTLMEQLGHISALEETKQITGKQAISESARLVKDNCFNREWHTNLVNHLTGKESNFFAALSAPFKALHRGDLFLFSVCALQFAPALSEKIAEQWFALITTLLLLDDAEDLKADTQTGDENAFLESGMTAEGLTKIKQLVNSNLKKMSTVNSLMATQLKKQFDEVVNILPF